MRIGLFQWRLQDSKGKSATFSSENLLCYTKTYLGMWPTKIADSIGQTNMQYDQYGYITMNYNKYYKYK